MRGFLLKTERVYHSAEDVVGSLDTEHPISKDRMGREMQGFWADVFVVIGKIRDARQETRRYDC